MVAMTEEECGFFVGERTHVGELDEQEALIDALLAVQEKVVRDLMDALEPEQVGCIADDPIFRINAAISYTNDPYRFIGLLQQTKREYLEASRRRSEAL